MSDLRKKWKKRFRRGWKPQENKSSPGERSAPWERFHSMRTIPGTKRWSHNACVVAYARVTLTHINSSTPHMPHHIFQKNDSQQKNDPVTTHFLPCTVSSKRSIPHSLQKKKRFGCKKRNSKSVETISKRTIPLHQHVSTPWERFCFMRRILLHENDSTAWERSSYGNQMRLRILRQTFLILMPRKPVYCSNSIIDGPEGNSGGTATTLRKQGKQSTVPLDCFFDK